MLRVVADEAAREDLAAGLDEIVREGARRMLAAALEAEVDAYVAALAGERDERGPPAGGAQRARPAAHDHDGRGRGRDPSARG